jgi:hypothetical protein
MFPCIPAFLFRSLQNKLFKICTKKDDMLTSLLYLFIFSRMRRRTAHQYIKKKKKKRGGGGVKTPKTKKNYRVRGPVARIETQ